MTLAFPLGAAAVAAACGWPVSAMADALSRRPGDAAVGHAPAGDDGAGLAHGRTRITASPWLMSLLLAAAAFGIGVRVHPALVAAAGCWLAICGASLAVIDIRVRRLPDVLTAACGAGIAALLAAAAAGSAGWHDLARAGEGGLAVAAFFGLLALARPGSAGLGDAKLGVSIGALTGWFSWGLLLASVFTSFVLAAAVGLWLMGTRRATMRGTSLPFGPFLLAGCLVVVLLAGVGHGNHVAALL